MITVAIVDFLGRPYPSAGTAEWKRWERTCVSFGPAAPTIFLEALEHGTDGEQIVALYGLRLHGYEAFADGYDRDYLYRVKAPGESEPRIIRPKVTPAPYPFDL